jgi:hypothetical protein
MYSAEASRLDVVKANTKPRVNEQVALDMIHFASASAPNAQCVKSAFPTLLGTLDYSAGVAPANLNSPRATERQLTISIHTCKRWF